MDKIQDTFDPLTGLRTQIVTSELDGKMHANYTQDLAPLVDFATALRNDEDYTRQGIKRGLMHVGTFDAVTIIELRKLGVDFYTASAKEIVAGVKKLNREYLLTTTARV